MSTFLSFRLFFLFICTYTSTVHIQLRETTFLTNHIYIYIYIHSGKKLDRTERDPNRPFRPFSRPIVFLSPWTKAVLDNSNSFSRILGSVVHDLTERQRPRPAPIYGFLAGERVLFFLGRVSLIRRSVSVEGETGKEKGTLEIHVPL